MTDDMMIILFKILAVLLLVLVSWAIFRVIVWIFKDERSFKEFWNALPFWTH